MKIAFADIETDALDATKIVLLCAEVQDLEDNTTCTLMYTDKSPQAKPANVNFDSDIVVFHNGVSFDVPQIERLWDWDFSEIQVVDTLLLSRMLFPERKSHSLKSWGDDLGFPKGNFDFEAWDKTLTPEVVKYCRQDVAVTRKLFYVLNERMKESGINWRAQHDFEYEVQQSVDNQAPFVFNTPKAEENLRHMEYKMRVIERDSEKYLPTVELPKSSIKYPPTKQFKVDGTPTVLAYKYFPKLKPYGSGWVFAHPDGSQQKLPYKKPLETHRRATFSNTAPLKDYLIELGWEPIEYNIRVLKDGTRERGSPKLYNESGDIDPGLERLGVHWVPELKEWLTLRSRVNVLKGWINKAKTDPGSGLQVIDTPAIACGARTSRMVHRDVVNVPRVTSPYGNMMREVFTCESDEVLVGWDASALEACMEAHEVWDLDRDYALALVDGTLHDRNAAAMGCTRDVAKTFKYACTYGASPPKLAKTLGISLYDASDLFDEFWKVGWSLREVRDTLIHEFNSVGSIASIDGRRLYPAYKHSVLNTRLQNSGAIVMKKALLIAEKNIGSTYPKSWASRVIAMHDEEQWRVRSGIGEIVGEIGARSVTQAGKELGIKPELKAEYVVGKTWADTH